MLNFLRKLRRNEMKSARYFKYAIGEIFLVMIGILLALGINNWNEERKNTIKEKNILAALKLEFEANKEDLLRAIILHEESTASGFELVGYFNQDISKIPQDRLDLLLLTVGETDSFDPRKGQLNSIISSGEINLVSNQELTILLSSFEDMVNDTQEELDAITRLSEELIALSGTYLNWGEINGQRYESPSNSSFNSDYEKLFKTLRIYNLISSLNVWRETMNTEEANQLKAINRMLELITIELDN